MEILIRLSSEPTIIVWMRILVVEDSEAMADAVTRGLKAEGYDVDVVNDGLDGIWQAREFPYDLLILDVMLPGMNGYEICRTLRAESATFPILMLTAKDGEYEIADGLDLGADDYLTKPFSFVEFTARVKALLRRSNPTPAIDEISIGDLAINTSTRQVTMGSSSVDLTPREYALLEVLARRPGYPHTRQDLLDHVWGIDFVGASNVVDVYIGYLRRKLDGQTPRPSDQPEADQGGTGGSLLETVRGVGYRLVVRQ